MLPWPRKWKGINRLRMLINGYCTTVGKNRGMHAKFRRIDDTSAPYQTTRLVFDNNLLALQSVSLSYELPRKISQKMYMERVKLLLSSTDLFRLSSVKQERGTSYPFARTFSIGLNVTF